jgi:uncharacterized membrane protein HdeD (DUF308 family)
MSSLLELRYRWWLRLLPGDYRDRWEEDMVAAFLDSKKTGDPGKDTVIAESGHPDWREEASVVALAIRLRLGGGQAPPRYVAWGQAVRSAVLIVILARVMMDARDVLFVAWAHRLISWPSAPPAHLNLILGIWPPMWYAVHCAWLAVYLGLVLGYRRAARLIAVLAAAADLTYLAASLLSASEPWAYWLLLDLAPVLAMAAFHRDAPPVPRRPWLAVLPAGLVLAAVPPFVIQVTDSAMALRDPAGLFCILIAAAGLLRLLLAWSGRTKHGSPWSLTLTLLAAVALALRVASLADYRYSPHIITTGTVEGLAVIAVGLALSRDAARELRLPPPPRAARTA